MDVESWITVTLLVDLIAAIFQIGAFVAPMWAWIQDSSTFVGIGLWYTVGCVGTTCVSAGTDATVEASAQLLVTVPFLVLRVLQSVGVGGVLGVSIMLVVYKAGYGSWQSMGSLNLAAFIICILTIIVLLASAVVFCVFYWPFFLFVNTNSTSLPWSPMMSFLAALILMIVAVFIRAKIRSENYQGPPIPISGDSKMEFYPQSSNGNIQKYWNQTPYEDRRLHHDDRRRYEDTRQTVITHSNRSYDDGDRRPTYNYDRPAFNDSRPNYSSDNRAYLHDSEPPYNKVTTNVRREYTRDYTQNGQVVYGVKDTGFSYVKGEVRDRYDDGRTGRLVALTDYPNQRHSFAAEDYYEHARGRAPAGGRSVLPPLPTEHSAGYVSPTYIYRPHAY